MMLFFDNAFIDVQASPSFPGVVNVRGRLRGDIERVFPQTKGRVSCRHGDSDQFRFSAAVSPEDLNNAFVEQARLMMAKPSDLSVLDKEHEPAHGNVWHVMRSAQAKQIEMEARARYAGDAIANVS